MKNLSVVAKSIIFQSQQNSNKIHKLCMFIYMVDIFQVLHTTHSIS